jgi:hypothetical protein
MRCAAILARLPRTRNLSDYVLRFAIYVLRYSMQPYTGTEPAPAQAAEEPRAEPVHPLEDLRNLMLIASGWIVVLLILPPQHDYPIIDDWIYAGSVQHFLNTGVFVMPPQSQANLFGLTLWGAAWVRWLGFSFTTLTYSTLFLSFVALFSFYGLARSLGTPPWGAMLGTALLAYNPIFVHLSYSFMSDVPFLALMLLSCFCYVWGLQGHGRAWLWIGGVVAGYSFLIRQFGLLIPLAFLVYLAFDSLLTRKLRLRDMVEVVAAPLAIIGGWYIWTSGTPPSPGAVQEQNKAAQFIMKEPWLRVILLRSIILLPLIALFSWTAIRIRRARWWLVALSGIVVLVVLLNVDLPNEEWVQTNLPVYTAQVGPVAVDFSKQLFTFGEWGNIIRVTGIDFFEYPQEAVLSPEFWHALWVAGLALGALLLAGFADAFVDWLAGHRQKQPLSPMAALYLLGAASFFVSVALLGDTFDRYILTFLPFVVLFVVRGSAAWGRLAWIYSLAALLLISTFTLLLKADSIEHDNARWQAGMWMFARTGAVHVGFDFNNWGSLQSSDTYMIADAPHPELDFRVEQQFPYFSRLGGLTTHYVYAQSKIDAPPLANPRPTPP